MEMLPSSSSGMVKVEDSEAGLGGYLLNVYRDCCCFLHLENNYGINNNNIKKICVYLKIKLKLKDFLLKFHTKSATPSLGIFNVVDATSHVK